MFRSISEENSIATTPVYLPCREIWIDVALAVAALGLIIFGTTAYFELGGLSGFQHASYFAYGAWTGAFLLAGGIIAKYFKRCSSNMTDDNLKQHNQASVLDHVPYSGNSNPLEPLLTTQDQLEAEPKDVDNGIEQKSHFRWDYIQFCLENEVKHYSNNYIGPDDSELSNLFLQCQDPEILFISRKEQRACSAFNINDQSNMELLTKKLKTAFLDGKKMAFLILDTGSHAIAAGFSSDGSFIIVDSLLNHSVDPKKMERMLNEAKLKNHTQKEIRFTGQFINTHIQKGGHECLRFATLYCYHMAVRKDLTAFKEVNGAFLEGRLRCFEDYKKITGAPRIDSLKDKAYKYRTFMQSWLYRSFGLTVNAWWQLTLHELSCMQGEFDAEMMSCYLTKSYLPKFYTSSDFSLEMVSSSLERQKITDQTVDTLNLCVNPDVNAPMKDALFKDNQSYLLIFIKNDSQPYLYSLKTDDKVEYSKLQD